MVKSDTIQQRSHSTMSCLPHLPCLLQHEVDLTVAVLQGLAMQRLILAMAERNGVESCDFEFVMVAGHFLARDENIFTFFEGVQVKPPEQGQCESAPATCASGV